MTIHFRSRLLLLVVAKLQGGEDGLTLEEEDSVAGFLGFHMERDPMNNRIKLTEKGLIKRIIEALNMAKLPVKHTPASHQTTGEG